MAGNDILSGGALIEPALLVLCSEQAFIPMEIDPELAFRAMREALEKYPRFEAYGPKLIARALFQGHALMLEYAVPPPRDDPDAWEFQNAVVKRYKSLNAS